MKNIQKLRCPRCKIGGYTQEEAYDGRPLFKCTYCDNSWTKGKSGGEYVLDNINLVGQLTAEADASPFP